MLIIKDEISKNKEKYQMMKRKKLKLITPKFNSYSCSGEAEQ